MHCPKCRQEEMRPEEYEGVHIERCPICKGMVFDQGEIRALIEKKQGNRADDLKFSPTSDLMDAMEAWCFPCNQKMEAVVAPGDVVINQCPTCKAIFLDAGELATMQLQFG